MYIGYEIKILSKLLEQHLNAVLSKDNITSSQFWVLLYLDERKNKITSQKDICQDLELKHTTVIGLIKRMAEKGLVGSTPNIENAKYRDVFLTEKGEQYTLKLRNNRLKVEAEILDKFTQGDVKQLEAYIKKIRENIEKL